MSTHTDMTPELWQRLKPLYQAALEKPSGERAQFIDNVCGEDDELKAELENLITSRHDQTIDSDDASELPNNLSSMPRFFFPGDLILGRFKIVRRIGTGGMGDVYEAIDLELGRVALKTIRPEIASSSDILARFKQEVALARQVSGPNVCRIYELFVIEGGLTGARSAFLTMELLEGATLSDKLHEDGPLLWKDAQKIGIEICAGLQAIHDAGIIHRDLKSRNVMLANRNGATCAVLMDFGLARRFSPSDSPTDPAFSKPGFIAGTPDYMAPEQFQGTEISPATDIYALGVVLYEMVTGKHPFEASSPVGAAVLRGRRPQHASSLRTGLPRYCDEIISRCLEFDQKQRFQSANEAAEALTGRWNAVARLKKNWISSTVKAASVILLLCSPLLFAPVRERLQGMLLSSRQKHIVVLPFRSDGAGAGTEALGDGLMDTLTGKLSNLGSDNRQLWVVPASEVRRRNVTDAASALREFGATIVVSGDLERHDQALNLNLTLVDTKRMRQIGFADIQDQDGDLAGMEDEAVTRLGRLMNVSVNEPIERGKEGQVVHAAYEDYLTAVGYLQRYDKAGNLDQAIGTLQKAVKSDPNFALAYAQLGEAYRLKYQVDQNAQWLDKAQEYCATAVKLDSHIPSLYVSLARIHESTGKNDLAVREYQQALALDPKDAEALSGLAHTYERAGRMKDAEESFQKAAALRPDYWDGYDELGSFYDRRQKYPEAVVQYRHAIELTPDNAQVYSNLGATYLDAGDPKYFPDAEKALLKSVSLSPSYFAYSNLGAMYGAEHRYADVAAVTELALELNDNDWVVWENLVTAYEWMHDDKKADAARRKLQNGLEKSVKLRPQAADAQSELASVYAFNKQNDKALRGIRTALVLAPEDPQVLTTVGETYELLGDRSDAVKYIQLAIQKGAGRDDLASDPHLQHLLAEHKFQFSPGKS